MLPWSPSHLKIFLTAVVLSACGSGAPELGEFPAISKIEGDAPFTLTAPSSPSPGKFSYLSDNLLVATISDNIVTVGSAGTSVISAIQAEHGKWGSNSVTTVLTVKPRPCTSPAVSKNGVCSAPDLPGSYLSFGGHTWMPVSLIDLWEDANAFCNSTTINAQTGWRLPTDFELVQLLNNVNLNDKAWLLSKTWSSIAGSTSGSRKTVNLANGIAGEESEQNTAYFTCLR
jgi:hypothetical protein